MASVCVQALLVICAIGVTFAWRHPSYFMTRRDSFCRKPGETCLENGQCCNKGSVVCATPYKGGRPPSTCKPISELQKGYHAVLNDGEECFASGQCRSGCCREIIRGRFMRSYSCGSPSDDVLCSFHAKYAYRSNDILEDY